MYNAYYCKVIRRSRIDDDTTTVKREEYIDDRGNVWLKTSFSQETTPTGIIVGRIDEDGNIWV